MLRLTMYAFGIDLGRTLRYKAKKKLGHNWDSDHSVGYMDPYVLRNDTIDEFDIILGMISYIENVNNLRITQNQFNKKIKLNCWLVVISDESFKLIQYQYHHGQLKKELISEHSLDEFKHGYAYVIRNADGYYSAVSYKDAYQYGCNQKKRFDIYKMSINHITAQYSHAFYNYKASDVEQDIQCAANSKVYKNDPIAYYDYCMRYVTFEGQSFTSKGIFTNGIWSNGTDKSFLDFIDPDKFKTMLIRSVYPIYYDNSEWEDYLCKA